MKRMLILILACLLSVSGALAEATVEATAEATVETTAEATVETTAEATAEETDLRLSGVTIGIDPGHQLHGNSEQEAVAPGSRETKAKVSSGTQGVRTGVPEYQVNLDVSLRLRDVLEALGATVVMTREVNDVDISNQERAKALNDQGCDLVLRIHCNGSENSKANGIGLYVNATGDIAEASYAAAEALLPAMVAATGARADGIFRRDTYTGLNWSVVPCILVEMGFMSNPDEDEKLNDPDYQALLAQGMADGVCAWLER